MDTVRCSFAATCAGSASCQDARRAAGAAATRAVARLVPAGHAGQIRVVRAPGSAPRVELDAGAGAGRPPRVSLTHSGGAAAAAAVPAGWLVGVDMEPAGSVDASDTRFFLSDSERRELQRQDATTLWCLKEAAWKALECDGAVGFKELELCFDADGALHLVRMQERVWRARARVLRLRRSWIAAVVRVREYVRHPGRRPGS